MKLISATAILGLAGCTSWGTHTVYGPKREVGRQLVGSPAIAESHSTTLGAGFVGAGGGGVAIAGLGANADSMRLTHCVQQAQITYEQPLETRPVVVGRPADVAGSIGLGLAGLITIGVTAATSRTVFEPGDPFYEEPNP